MIPSYLHWFSSTNHGGYVWKRDARGLAEVGHQPPELVQGLVLHQDVIPVENDHDKTLKATRIFVPT